MTSLYATLADVRGELLAENTVDDGKVMRLIRQFSSRIDRLFKQRNASLFVPTIETRTIDISPDSVNSYLGTLFLRTPQNGISPLLELLGVAINTNTLVVGTNVQVYPTPIAPYYQIQLMGAGCNTWYSYATCANQRGAPYAGVNGIWGYNANYAEAWLAVDTLTAAIIDTTTTTFMVSDVEGDNPLGEAPRISAGNVIQIDTEWMNVVATDATMNTVTVTRGVNGSTAATHLIDTPVSVWQTDESIRRAVTRQVSFLYSRQGAYDNMRIDGIGVVQYPPDMLQEVNDLLGLFYNM